MYAITLQECNYGFYACAHWHHNSCIGQPHGAAARQKREAQRLTRMREDTGCKRGEAEDDAEREQRLSRMRDHARSRREAEDGVYIAHGPTGNRVFCSATEVSVIDFISK